MDEDDDIDEMKFFQSKEFREGIRKTIEENTWGKGLPKIYLDKDGWIVKHWKNGKIEKIKKIK